MQDPPTLWVSKLGLDQQYEFLTAGQHYRVTQQFIDFDKRIHPLGEQWLFLGTSFQPYDDGRSFFVSVDGVQESQIRLRDAPEDQGEFLSHLKTYLAPLTSERS